jgi:hypothetical protein
VLPTTDPCLFAALQLFERRAHQRGVPPAIPAILDLRTPVRISLIIAEIGNRGMPSADAHFLPAGVSIPHLLVRQWSERGAEGWRVQMERRDRPHCRFEIG